MKKLLFLLPTLMMAFFMYSCDNNDPEPKPKPKPEDPTVYELDINIKELKFGYNATEPQYINVKSKNVTWTVAVGESAKGWITTEKTADKISVIVSENTGNESRSGIITVTPDTDKVPAKEIKVTQSGKQSEKTDGLDIVVSKLEFYGNDYKVDESHYALHLGSGDAKVLYEKDFDMHYISVQNGYYIYLDLVTMPTVIPDEYQNPRLATGTYTCSKATDVYEPMTFMKTTYNEGTKKYGNSVVTKFTKGAYESYKIDAGNVKVDRKGDVYIINFELNMADGTTLSGSYKKEIDIISNKVSSSTMKEDVIQKEMKLADSRLFYYGIDSSNRSSWVIEMISEGLSANNEGDISGSGYFVSLYMYGPASASSTVLPDGTYTLTDKTDEFSALPGYLDFIDNIGCFITLIEKNDPVKIAYLKSGQVTVKHNSENNYTLSIDSYSDAYYKVNINCTGNFKYLDKSKPKTNK